MSSVLYFGVFVFNIVASWVFVGRDDYAHATFHATFHVALACLFLILANHREVMKRLDRNG